MTTEGATATLDATALADDDALFCYRHPGRETRISCGRCERPICTRCAMQGPVGFRCRACGKPTFDPMTSFTPRQMAVGGGLALGGGILTGVAAAVGLLAICVALFIGGFAAEAVRRAVGYKRGPIFSTLMFGGLLVGGLAGYALIIGGLWLPAGPAADGGQALDALFLTNGMGWALLVSGIACVGAYSRLR